MSETAGLLDQAARRFARPVRRATEWFSARSKDDRDQRIRLRDNTKHVRVSDLRSFGVLMVPALVFGCGLLFLGCKDPRYAWVWNPVEAPWEFWGVVASGSAAAVGGVGDWLFHRLFVSTGPEERRAHFIALATGGVPLSLIMASASVVSSPQSLLLPSVVVALYTTVLVCYDEFVFHHKRCLFFETTLHRLLVFGNGFAWLCWMHWCFVRWR